MAGSEMAEPDSWVPTQAESDRLRHWVLSNQALTIEEGDVLTDLLDGAGIALRLESRREEGFPPALRALAQGHARLLGATQRPVETRQ